MNRGLQVDDNAFKPIQHIRKRHPLKTSSANRQKKNFRDTLFCDPNLREKSHESFEYADEVEEGPSSQVGEENWVQYW